MYDPLLQIVRQAGNAILEFFRKPAEEVLYKKDSSPVSLADLSSHRILLEGLRAVLNIPVLSEESIIPYDVRRHWDEFWLVDPLDGTLDFLEGSDEFSINVALIRKNQPVLGMIFSPAKNLVYFAEQGAGARVWRQGHFSKLPCHNSEGPVLVRSRHHDSPHVARFCRLNEIHRTLTLGSALKFGALAEGSATVYPRYDGSKEWDVAAGHLILREAGGHLYALPSLEPITYNKPSVENPFFLAVSSHAEATSFKIPLL